MAAEDFFTRWSKKKTDAKTVVDAEVSAADNSAHSLAEQRADEQVNEQSETTIKPLPTQEDVDKLTHDSDYSAFMSQGVDESVKRSAMKKLFTDPHFNIMDGLDIYIDDYNKFEPITPALLASLNHAKSLLDPLAQLQTPLMRLLEKLPETKEVATEGEMPAIEEPIAVADGEDISSSDGEQKEEYVEPPASQEIEILPEQTEFSERNAKAKPDVNDV